MDKIVQLLSVPILVKVQFPKNYDSLYWPICNDMKYVKRLKSEHLFLTIILKESIRQGQL